MAAIEARREILKVLDDGFVVARGKKERRASIKHLGPLEN